MKRVLVSIAALAVAGGGGWYGWTWYAGSAAEESARTYDAVEVAVGSIALTVNTDGRVEALLTVDIKSKASGTVQEVLVSEAETVRADGVHLSQDWVGPLLRIPLYDAAPGQLLMTLDPIDEQRNVDKMQALLNAETAKVQRERATLARLRETLRDDLEVAQAEEAAAVSEAEQADAAYDSALLDRIVAETNLADAEVKAKRQEELYNSPRRLTSKEELENALTLVSRFRNELKQVESAIRGAAAKATQARARVTQTKAKVKLARANLQGVRVQEQEIKLAEATVQVAGVALADAHRRLAETEIVAPINGVVTKKYVDKGQVIAGGVSNVGGGTALLTIADVSQLFVMASVPEADIANVRDPVGADRQKVRITADAYPGQVFEGEVVYRVPQAITENNVTTVKVRIEITDARKSLLLPGMTCNVEILAQKKDKALVVPAAAVQRGEGDQRFVYLLDEEGRPQQTAVKVGITTATKVEITSGLTAGQKIVASAAAVDQPRRGPGGPSSSGGGSRSARGGMQSLVPRR